MTTLRQIELTCPICFNRFSSQAVLSTNSFGGKRTDFHERAAGAQPLPYFIHLCSRCGYAGSERDFGEEAEVSPSLKEHVWDELAPRLADAALSNSHPGGSNPTPGPTASSGSASGAGSGGAGGGAGGHAGANAGAALAIAGSEKYEFAAKVATWQGAEPRRVADLLLRAAWCCVDEGDTEAERYFRRQAAWAFERALASYDGVERDERAVLTYLVGELWRRVGDLTKAHDWFDRVERELTNRRKQQWLIDAAVQQRDRPREWFG
jgi:uncharacterized protein